MKVVRSSIIDAPLSRVWQLIRDFNSHAIWHPAVSDSEIENNRCGDEVGCIRHFRLNDGSELREQLIKLSDDKTTLTYAIVDSPIPLLNYVATLTFRPVTDGDRTLLVWNSSFNVPRGRESELTDLVGKKIYETGIRGLQDYLRKTDQRIPDNSKKPFTRTPVIKDEAVPAQAVMIDQPGDTDRMSLCDTLVPAPAPGEVRVRQTAIGINFYDTYQRSGKKPFLSYPATLGIEAAGIVEDVGPGVSGFFPGDRIVYAQLPAGSYATVRNVPASWCVPIPNGITDRVAAASFLRGVTAEFILHQVSPVDSTKVILVHSAAGGLGSILVQWAKARGATVIGTVSTEEKAKLARSLGCDWPIIRSHSDFAEATLSITKGHGVDIVVDSIGTDTLNHSVKALARFGCLVSVGGTSGSPDTIDIEGLTEKSASFVRPVYFHYASDPALLRAMAARFFSMLEQERIRVTIHKSYDLSDAAQAHEDLESGKTSGSLILLPGR